jgi:hypothetical protein
VNTRRSSEGTDASIFDPRSPGLPLCASPANIRRPGRLNRRGASKKQRRQPMYHRRRPPPPATRPPLDGRLPAGYYSSFVHRGGPAAWRGGEIKTPQQRTHARVWWGPTGGMCRAGRHPQSRNTSTYLTAWRSRPAKRCSTKQVHCEQALKTGTCAPAASAERCSVARLCGGCDKRRDVPVPAPALHPHTTQRATVCGSATNTARLTQRHPTRQSATSDVLGRSTGARRRDRVPIDCRHHRLAR